MEQSRDVMIKQKAPLLEDETFTYLNIWKHTENLKL